jgi:uncharacterized protein (TIGR00369 family)
MQSPNPNYRDNVEQGFHQAAFLADLGIRLTDCGPGWCESILHLESRHLQQTGVAHAGVQSTIADHTAGGAAMSMTAVDEIILTVEFKIHLLRPGAGKSLWCRAEVLKPGRQFHVVESQVYAIDGDRKTLVSKLTGTMAVLKRNRE